MALHKGISTSTCGPCRHVLHFMWKGNAGDIPPTNTASDMGPQTLLKISTCADKEGLTLWAANTKEDTYMTPKQCYSVTLDESLKIKWMFGFILCIEAFSLIKNHHNLLHLYEWIYIYCVWMCCCRQKRKWIVIGLLVAHRRVKSAFPFTCRMYNTKSTLTHEENKMCWRF